MVPGCVFCEHLENDGWSGKSVLQRTSTHIVVTDKAPLVPNGHVLGITTKHYLSFAEALRDSPDQSELLVVPKHIISVLGHCCDDEVIMFFEHGPIDEYERGGSCVDHAHLHGIRISLDKCKRAIMQAKHAVELHQIDNWTDALKEQINVNRPRPYLLIGYSNQWFLGDAYNLPSQFMRWILAEILGVLNIHWTNVVDDSN